MLTNNNSTRIKRPIYYDSKTKNASFKKMHVILKRLGVKNNKFFLKVYDPKLIGVDPFDPNLDEEMITRIRIECTKNIYYFLRECVRIKISGGTLPYTLHRGNLAMTFCYNNRLSHYVELPRQNYKTGSAMANILHSFNFGTRNTSMMLLHQKKEGSTENLQELKDMRSELPVYLRNNTSLNAKGEEKLEDGNQSELKNLFNDNHIKCYASVNSEKNADRLGRGCSQAIQFQDEFAFTPYIETIFMASGPAYAEASLQAAKNNTAYCRVIASTPGDLSDRDGAFAKGFIGLTARFYDSLYDESKEEILKYIEKNSGNDFLYIRYTYPELGRDEKYFARQCRILNQNRAKIRREVLLEWSSGNSSSPFEPIEIENINKLKVPIVKIETLLKYFKVKLYEDINMFTPVMISIDAASGLNNDASAIVVRHFFKKNVVATFKNNKIPLGNFSKLIVKLVENIFPNSIVAIERNNPGGTLIEMLMETSVKDKLYKDLNVDETIDKYDKDGYLDADVIRRKAYGVYTKASNRDIMFDCLGELVTERPEVFRCEDLTDEISGLIKDKRGKILAGPGCQDDLVMAFNIGEYVFRFGKNLNSYGLNKYDFLTIEDELQGDDRLTSQEDMLEIILSQVNSYSSSSDEAHAITELIKASKRVKTSEDIHKEHRDQIIADTISINQSNGEDNVLSGNFNNMISQLNSLSEFETDDMLFDDDDDF